MRVISRGSEQNLIVRIAFKEGRYTMNTTECVGGRGRRKPDPQSAPPVATTGTESSVPATSTAAVGLDNLDLDAVAG